MTVPCGVEVLGLVLCPAGGGVAGYCSGDPLPIFTPHLASCENVKLPKVNTAAVTRTLFNITKYIHWKMLSQYYLIAYFNGKLGDEVDPSTETRSVVRSSPL